MFSALRRLVVQVILVVLETVFALIRKKQVYPFPYNTVTNSITLPAQIDNELQGLIAVGKPVEAVKRVTNLTGAGLRIAKDYVDQMESREIWSV
jgi:ribosomal protein L7/L12